MGGGFFLGFLVGLAVLVGWVVAVAVEVLVLVTCVELGGAGVGEVVTVWPTVVVRGSLGLAEVWLCPMVTEASLVEPRVLAVSVPVCESVSPGSDLGLQATTNNSADHKRYFMR